MRKTCLVLTCFIFPLITFSQYWQQQVNHTIHVTLNDKEHSVNGFQRIEYINNSPDTLKYIWFHVWPNAYKNDKTAFTDQMLENGSTEFYFSSREERGYINRLEFKVNDITADVEDHPQHIDIIKLILPVPLPPRRSINITTPFHVKLPKNFSRSGHDGESYMLAQWYPKPAVYDKNGWHPMPYLEQGEFYNEFGNYDVSITLPQNYVVAATGDLQDNNEKQFLLNRKDFDWKPVVTKEKNKGGQVTKNVQEFPPSASELKTIRYVQQNVHDFAWFADKRFVVKNDTVALDNGHVVNVQAFYTPISSQDWSNVTAYAKAAIRHYSALVGPYPYNTVSVVEAGRNLAMEYPTITSISGDRSKFDLNITVAHEIGHNWFYGMLASNERKFPWLDEGVNSYYESLYQESIAHFSGINAERLLFDAMTGLRMDQPINTSSEDFTDVNYGMIAYYKTGKWLEWLKSHMGEERFNKAMRYYFEQWKFKHPRPEDFKNSLETSSGINLDSAFQLLEKKGPLPNDIKKGFAIQGPGGSLLRKNAGKKNVISLGPMVGFNSYDKLMAGIYITNYHVPLNKIQFVAVPMYATGSKKITGIGAINATFFPGGFIRRVDAGLNASSFTSNMFEDEQGEKHYPGFRKIVPNIKFTFREKTARSTTTKFVRFRNYNLDEDNLRFYRDSVITPTDTTIFNRVRIVSEGTTINQLQFVIENNRKLYPYRADLRIDQGRDFVRAGLTGKYFFNYPKSGGFNLRVFAGKFFYTSERTISKEFNTSRYHLNLLAPNGFEDYTYSDYFVGRNHFEGLASQQVMERDGAMHMRLEQFEGDPSFRRRVSSDNWIASVNMSTTLPHGFLPSFLPLKLFADLGTTSGAWEEGNTYGKFSFVAGLQLSLLKNTINIYAPILYSREFRNLIETDKDNNKFFKKISFSIDLFNFSLKKIDRHLEL